MGKSSFFLSFITSTTQNMDSTEQFDVIIVGAGITGAIIAKSLVQSCKGLNILMLDAGSGDAKDFRTYEKYNDQYYNALAKTPNSPYPDSPMAPSPSVLSLHNIKEEGPITSGYFVQKGPFPFLSNYNRNVGGTTLHWLGTCLRMCPNDFKLKSTYGQGVDWPMSYEELMPYYRQAELEIGVSAEVEEQKILGIEFEKDYVFPMHKIPQSYLDRYMSKGLEGMTISFHGVEYPIKVISTPQGRNGMPNKKYFNEQTQSYGFTPVGAVGAPELGQRCEGNANCVPICPVQAKYNALKTLQDVLNNRDNTVRLINQAPVHELGIDPDTQLIKQVFYKKYATSADGKRSLISTHEAQGKIVVLAAHAIENAKILLASRACTTSGQVGKNLMDHLVMLTWGLLPEAIGSYRGPGSTSGMPLTRDGSFRSRRAAFRVEIGNWGWNWPANTPESTLLDAVDNLGLSGKELIAHVRDIGSRQFRMGWEFEQLPEERNRIEISDDYRDELGNYRPIIHYHIDRYQKLAARAARRMSKKIFRKLNVEEFTSYKETDAGYFEFRGRGYTVNGAGHLVGTHRMGENAQDGVVDVNQRAFDHPNLFVAGCGSMRTIATSNPTLTMAALAFKTAEAIAQEF